VTLWGTMQVHAWYSEVVVELYCNKLHSTNNNGSEANVCPFAT